MAGKRIKRYEAKPCRNCGKTFSPVTSWQVYCCDNCHDDFWATKNPIVKIAKMQTRLSVHAKILAELIGDIETIEISPGVFRHTWTPRSTVNHAARVDKLEAQ